MLARQNSRRVPVSAKFGPKVRQACLRPAALLRVYRPSRRSADPAELFPPRLANGRRPAREYGDGHCADPRWLLMDGHVRWPGTVRRRELHRVRQYHHTRDEQQPGDQVV